jgi:trimethylamine---corrinoid protein Co-methyltransferase
MQFEALSARDAEHIHESALAILQDVGFLLPGASRLAVRLREAGLPVDPDGRLRLPRATVEAALRKAPRTVRLGARDPARTAVLDGTRTYVTTDGCGAQTIDPATGLRRPACLLDVAQSARIADALDAYHVYWMMVSAQDVPLERRVAAEYLTALRSTTKHVQMIDVARPEEASLLARLAGELLQTGTVQEAPVSMLTSVVSPLRIDPGGTESALLFAAAGLPVVACSMPIASVTAPATAAGTLLLAHAEIVGFTALLEVLHPGAPVIYCSFPAFADARTGTTNYRDPRRFWTAAAASRMGLGMNLPCFTSGELASLLVRPDLLCFGGLLEVSTLLALEQLVIDAELLRDWKMAAAAQEVSVESLALEAIADVGPGGHFLAHRHTVKHIREFVVPKFAEPERAVDPTRAGTSPESPRDRARREALRILETHTVPPIPEKVDAALAKILEEPAAVAAP